MNAVCMRVCARLYMREMPVERHTAKHLSPVKGPVAGRGWDADFSLSPLLFILKFELCGYVTNTHTHTMVRKISDCVPLLLFFP